MSFALSCFVSNASVSSSSPLSSISKCELNCAGSSIPSSVRKVSSSRITLNMCASSETSTSTGLRMEDVCEVGRKRTGNVIEGPVFVVGDNIDTDQIIPAEYLTLVPSVPEEYAKLGTYAMIGLPDKLYKTRYIDPEDTNEKGICRTKYPIIIAGDNFGCGSSREHAPIAIGAAGGKVVIAESYARIFFRNCSATGELYPWETPERLVEKFSTGDRARVDFENECVVNVTTGKEYKLNPIGDVGPVVDAGGIFEFARRSGMITMNSTC
eukprot:CAMPEP_0182444600 /NCGR_PEP_ID=MMETSP1172-20130603/3003_1 /TAXON_ID=708627 /ORGANISM="Timspurckia oligopyrenoides, Strain CCMP3278" /LENGTH=267 /DNA_ID=CAMNT_0024640197 /DNA_START=38 /DNA_END=841 /DNA_ORIENTATION=-